MQLIIYVKYIAAKPTLATCGQHIYPSFIPLPLSHPDYTDKH